MALTLVTTVGSASANSYCTKAEADTFAETLFPASAGNGWHGASADDQLRALVSAARQLDQERFVGDRVDATQALEWPRTGARKPALTEVYDSDEIPEPVKQAQARLAFWLLERIAAEASVDPLAPTQNAGIASVSLPTGLSMSFETGTSSVTALSRFLSAVIRPILGRLVYAPSARAVRG